VITVPDHSDQKYGQPDGQTDRQTACCGITGLCVASRGKKINANDCRNAMT